MNRSVGVTAVAVVAILEGLVACLFGAFALLALVVMRAVPRPTNMPEPPIAAGVLFLVEGLAFLGVGSWMIASAIGLLRLKNWARISISVLGGVLAVVSFFGLLGAAMIANLPLPTPPGREVPHGLMTTVAWVMATLCLVQMAVGIWWPVQLNRRAVKGQFLGERIETQEPGRPLAITIIAWLMIVSGLVSAPFVLLQDAPAMFFGLLIPGWAGRIFYLVYMLAYVGLGIGLLKLMPRCLTYTVWLNLFLLANMVVTYLFPDALNRYMESAAAELPKDHPWATSGMPSVFLWAGMAFGALVAGVQLWFLITRKQAYLAAAERARSRLPAA